jgi:glycosyltransferase involved in cell wall biosynthesis
MGGGTRVAMLVAKGFCLLGYPTDIVVAKSGGPLDCSVPINARMIALSTRNDSSRLFRAGVWISGVHYAPKLIAILPRLALYLRRNRPTVLITFAGGLAAVLANRLSGGKTRIAIAAGAILSDIERNGPHLQSAIRRALFRALYSRADVIIAASRSIADDLIKTIRIDPAIVSVIPNPVLDGDFDRLAEEHTNHPWLNRDDIQVLIGAGLLARHKDFATLIKAFREVHTCKPSARLLVLGEGSERPALESLIRELRLSDSVQLPGFELNPYKLMSRSSVFVLSSKTEGFGNVIAEALALGVPVVTTECGSGPVETLEGGKYGRLVPVGNANALAVAILETLQAPPNRERLRVRGRDFSVETILPQYIKALGLAPISKSM